MPRVKLFNQEEALDKAKDLFWEKGFEATSLTDLTDRLGIGKGSFYDTFKGKRPLFERALTSYSESNLIYLKETLYSKTDVKEGIRHLIETVIQYGLNDDKHKGCFVANTCSELGNSDEEIRPLLLEHNKKMHHIFVEYLNSGNLNKTLDTDQVAKILITFLTGLNQELKIKRDSIEMNYSLDLLLKLLD